MMVHNNVRLLGTSILRPTATSTAMRGVHTAIISLAFSAASASAFATTTATNHRGAFVARSIAHTAACGSGWSFFDRSSTTTNRASSTSTSLHMSSATDFAKKEIEANKVVVFRYVLFVI
jgi:hypothetical protein